MNKKKTYIVLLLLAIFSFSCNSTKMDKSIVISFEIKNKNFVDICDNFSIKFIYNNTVHKGKINGCKLELPDFPNNVEYVDVVFNHDNYSLKFEKVKLKWLLINQKMNWNFQVSLPPFDEVNNAELNIEDIEMIYYFQFNPLEEGQAIEIINPVYKNEQ